MLLLTTSPALADRGGQARTVPDREVARSLALQRGWGPSEYRCLSLLWDWESGWRWWAANQHSDAYGIAQALPGNKMAIIAADWKTNAITQIRWGLYYIYVRYHTPCQAMVFHSRHNYY
jgi:hypothetical protein